MSARPFAETAPVDSGAWRPTEALTHADGEAAPGLVTDLLSLAKPRLTALVLVTTAGGYSLAPGRSGLWPMLQVVFATAMLVGSANSLNCWMERDVDRRMRRTRNRPLPAGRLRPAAAVIQAALLASLGVPLLWFSANGPLAAVLGLLAIVLYAGVYTPLKRRSSLATVVGAIPGALPPLIGWTAATGRIELPGLVLFGILFLWQIPHFLALSVMLAEEYAEAGLRVLPIDPAAFGRGEAFTRWNVVLWTLALLPVSLLPVPLGLAGELYGVGALLAGLAFLGQGALGLRLVAAGNGGAARGDAAARERRWAGRLFAASIVYLSVLFLLLACDSAS